ncbi:MAG: Mrp/NBP35 family ATP-binding protein [Leptospirales bacterium]
MPSIKKIIAVGSGKGGVGKSTVSINLAASLAAKGYKVGLLDADLYGPSIGQMAGFTGKTDLPVTETKIKPPEKYGMKMISFSMLIERAQAVVWRGPMLGKALEQLIFDIDWGRLDYLIIDLPPGTGDIQLSMAQLVEVDGFVIVTTPQNVALHDAERAADMLKKVNIPILGIVENMSEFICPSCGHSTHIFSQKGGETIAKELKVNLLGSIPITSVIMESGEKGIPLTVKEDLPWDKKDVEPIVTAYDAIIENLQKRLKQNANT